MIILALETATECCSVALMLDDQVISRSEIAPRRHAELLLPMCDEVLAEAGIGRGAIDAIAVGRGPGAFTGVRLAVSSAQGLALGLDVPVIPVSSLAALAADVPSVDAEMIVALIDARMGEVYAGTYRRGPSGGPELVGQETVASPTSLVWPQGTFAVVGSGWQTYGDLLSHRMAVAAVFTDGLRFPQAAAIARLAGQASRDGLLDDAAMALPVYLRDQVAMTIDEQRKARMADR